MSRGTGQEGLFFEEGSVICCSFIMKWPIFPGDELNASLILNQNRQVHFKDTWKKGKLSWKGYYCYL